MAVGSVAGTTIVEIVARTRRLEAGLAKARNRVKRFHDTLDAMATAGLAMTGFMAAGFTAVLKVTADYEQEMRNVNSVLQVSSVSMRALGTIAFQMARTTIYAAREVAQGFYYLASAGYRYLEVAKAMPPIVNLAIATQFNLAETTKLVITTMKAFHLETSDATRVSNVFAAAIARSQARIELLWKSMAYVAPVAASLGWSIEKTVAVLALLYNAGFSASLAATATRGALDRFTRSVPKTNKVLRRLGLTFADIDSQTVDFADAIEKLRVAGITTAQVYEIFGRRAAPAVMILLRNVPALREMESAITGTNKAQEMMLIQMTTLKASVKILVNTFKTFFITMGEGLTGPLRDMINGLRGALGATQQLMAEYPRITKLIMSTGLTLTILTGTLAGGVKVIHLAVAAWKMMNITMAAWMGPAGLAILAIGALVGLLVFFRKEYEEQAKIAKERVEALRSEAEEVFNLVKEYNKLGEVQKKSATQTEKMWVMGDRLRELYPSLTVELRKLGEAAEITAEQIEKMNRAQVTKELLARYQERIALVSDHSEKLRELTIGSITSTSAVDKEYVRRRRLNRLMERSNRIMEVYGELSDGNKTRLQAAQKEWLNAKANIAKLRAEIVSLSRKMIANTRYTVYLEKAAKRYGMTQFKQISAAEAMLRRPTPLTTPIPPTPEAAIERGQAAMRARGEMATEVGATGGITVNVTVEGGVADESTARDMARQTASKIDDVLRRGGF